MRTFNSQIGTMLVYEPGQSAEEIKAIIEGNDFCGLRIDLIFEGEIPKDRSIFRELNFLKALSWNVVSEISFDFLYTYDQLQFLAVQTMFSPIDFDQLRQIEHLSITWNKKMIKNLSSLENLKTLGIVDYDELDLLPISELINIKRLRISTGKCKSLKGIENLKALEVLSLGAFRSLNELKGVQNLQNLKFLEMDMCPKVTDYSPLSGLENLKVLELLDCKGLSSISFVSDLTKLEQLTLLGSTKVGDNNLKPAKNVKRVYYNHKKDYNLDLRDKEIQGERVSYFNYSSSLY
ncbi:MAG: hypothetical protein MJA30_23630 [Cytophagales bacterium]|nr:hypothetical protein [Cytophagales bacterium]